MDAAGEIARALSHLREPYVLDAGCGSGVLAKALAGHAAGIVGIDPNSASIAAARREAPMASFAVGTAESLPFRAEIFDAVVLLNALHHVPDPRRGLLEARRVSRGGALIVVVEPLAEGSFFEALRCVEDETEVRAGAQRAIRELAVDGALASERCYAFERVDHFVDLDAFLARVVAVDPARGGAVKARRAQIADVFARVAERGDAGYRLRQPLRVDVLLVPDGRERRRASAPAGA